MPEYFVAILDGNGRYEKPETTQHGNPKSVAEDYAQRLGLANGERVCVYEMGWVFELKAPMPDTG
ncbi:MAG: hypothetical protein WEC81_00685 [Patescibacteria group bacterium]